MQRLRELGWVEGRTVAIEYHWAEGRRERAAEIAAEYVRLKVDVIIGGGTEAAIAELLTSNSVIIRIADRTALRTAFSISSSKYHVGKATSPPSYQ